jgi:electron transport complex protein RnfG
MLRNNFVRYAVILGAICLAASALLAVVYNVTRPKILLQKSLEEQSALKEVFPAAENFEPVAGDGAQGVLCYIAYGAGRQPLGVAFKASRKGYSSLIETMVGMTSDGVIQRIKILSQNETPGLGTRVTEVLQKETLWDVLRGKGTRAAPPQPWFQAQFNGKPLAGLDGSVETITGATITSQAVIDSIREQGQAILEKMKR